MTLYLTEAEVESLVTTEDALAAVQGSLERQAEGVIQLVPRRRLELEDGAFATMAAADAGLELAGLKAYTWLPGGTPFVVCLFSTDKPGLVAVIEADKLGQLRTGAASGVAARFLARPEARSLGIIGCGWQAESQVASIRAAVPSIDRVVAYCRNEKRLKAFCKKVKAEPGETHRDAGELDIVVTVTTSKDPVLRGEWLRPGALVCAVGANDPSRRELDNVVLERASFVCCDSREQSRLESGDLVEPVERGVLDWLEVHELHEVVSGELEGRADPEDIIVFKSNGIAAWDVAIGARAVELARERKVGLDVGAR